MKKTKLFVGLSGLVGVAMAISPLVSCSCDQNEPEIKPTGVKLDKTSLELKIGESATLHATVEPTGVSQEVVWSSDKTNIATVVNGEVKAIAKGTAIITVTPKGYDLPTTCVVNVIEQPEEIISWNEMVGDSDAWVATSSDKLKIESGKKYQVEFDWTECGAKMGEEDDVVMVYLCDDITNIEESYDFTGSTYKLEAFNTTTNQWETIEGLAPEYSGGVNVLFVDDDALGHKPWKPNDYKRGCKFTFSASKSSSKQLGITIYIDRG